MSFDAHVYVAELRAARETTVEDAVQIALDPQLSESRRVAFMEAAFSRSSEGRESCIGDEILLKFLRDRSPLVQLFAIRRSGERNSVVVRDELWRIWSDKHTNSHSAMLELVSAGDHHAFEICLQKLHEFPDDEKAHAIATIGLTRNRDALPFLEQQYRSTNNTRLKPSLALAIARCGGESTALLEGCVMFISKEERVPIVCELASVGSILGLSQLRVLLDDATISEIAIWRSLVIAGLIDATNTEWRSDIRRWIDEQDEV